MNLTHDPDFLAGQRFGAEEVVPAICEEAEDAERPDAFLLGAAINVIHSALVAMGDARFATDFMDQTKTAIVQRIATGPRPNGPCN
jgi:hypothetical protein